MAFKIEIAYPILTPGLTEKHPAGELVAEASHVLVLAHDLDSSFYRTCLPLLCGARLLVYTVVLLVAEPDQEIRGLEEVCRLRLRRMRRDLHKREREQSSERDLTEVNLMLVVEGNAVLLFRLLVTLCELASGVMRLIAALPCLPNEWTLYLVFVMCHRSRV